MRLIIHNPFSNSLIRKLFLWFQQNRTKESYDTNRIVCIGLNAWFPLDRNGVVKLRDPSKF